MSYKDMVTIQEGKKQLKENRGRQYISGLCKMFFTFFIEFVYGGLCFFQPKTFCTSRRIFPEILSLIDAAVSEQLGNKQTHRQTHRLTDILLVQKKDNTFFFLSFYMHFQTSRIVSREKLSSQQLLSIMPTPQRKERQSGNGLQKEGLFLKILPV